MSGVTRTRRLVIACTFTATLAVLAIGGGVHAEPSSRPPVGPPVWAAGPPTYESDSSCPPGSDWRQVIPSGPEHLSAAYDHNRDGKVCLRITKGTLVFMDNVVR